MNVFDAISHRYSVRSYRDKAVEREKLHSIFSAVRLAPSAKNMQEWRFILVTDPALRAKVAAAGGQPFLKDCPVIIVACAETNGYVMRCGESAYPIDMAIAIDHLTLAATAMGLGTCWIGSFDAPAVKESLGIPDEVPVVELVALGYPAGDAVPAAAKSRRPLDEILMENGWNQAWRY